MAEQYNNKEIELDGGTSPVNIDFADITAREYNVIGTATLSANKSITADIAADLPEFPGSSVPSFQWNGLRLVFNWYARITLGAFSIDFLGRVLTQREALSNLRIVANYLESEGGWVVSVEIIDSDRTYFQVSYTEAAALIAVNGLKPGSIYIISDAGRPNTDGEIQLRAVTNNKFAISGAHTFAKSSTGTISFSGGAVGSSIDTITVDGNNVLTGVIGWNTDLDTTIADAVSNINADSVNSGITAVSYADLAVIFLSSLDPGNALNSKIVGGSVTAGLGVLAITGTSSMEQGLDEYDKWFEIEYDFANDFIFKVSDSFGNIFIPKTVPSSLYKSAPWGDTNISFCLFSDIDSPILIFDISGEITKTSFKNTIPFITAYSGSMRANEFIGDQSSIVFLNCGADVKFNRLGNGNYLFRDLDAADEVLNNDITEVDLKVVTTGTSLIRNRIVGKDTWADMVIAATLDEAAITPQESTYEIEKSIAVNAIDLSSAVTDVGAGIVTILNTGTLNTINNTANVADKLIVRPAVGTVLTVDPGTATNIAVLGVAAVVLDGSNEDYCVLTRASNGTSWLMASFHNY